MSCSPYDLRDFLLAELTPSQNGEMRAHLSACSSCAHELQDLRLTHSALLTLHDEEMPQRIGFVSDKIFEPHPLRRWLAGFWNSAARLGFVSAAMLSIALLTNLFVNVHKNAQIAQTPPPAAPTLTMAQVDARIHQAVAAQIDAAVTKAVADTEQRAQIRTNALLAAAEKRSLRQIQSLAINYQQNLDLMNTRRNMALVSANYGGAQ